jgi:enolase
MKVRRELLIFCFLIFFMAKTSIQSIEAREILDSRGNPTVEATVTLEDGSVGSAAVPSGASTGSHEALEMRDGGKRYGGKGVLKAVKNANTKIAGALKGFDASDPRGLDAIMIKLDGTESKKKLGANAILSVSLASARAAANSAGLPLYQYIRKAFGLSYDSWRMPVPTMNILNGGVHGNNGLSIQEFMIVPQHKKLSERVRIGCDVFHALKTILKKKNLGVGVGDEGGFAPHLKNNEEALKLIVQAVKEAKYKLGKDVKIAMDMASSEFYKDGKYFFEGRKGISSLEMIKIVKKWIKKYPFVSIEDALAEDDWEAWHILTREVKGAVKLVGDDLFVTNPARLQEGIDHNVASAILIKVNQIGTLSETIDAITLAQFNNYAVSVSHRSGETGDTFIADLAVAVNAEFIKTGSLSRSERIEKYNRLMKIEMELQK